LTAACGRADAERDSTVLAGGHDLGGVGGTAEAIGPDDAVFLDVAVSDRDGDALQTGRARDRARAAAAGQPPSEVAATVIGRTVASTNSASVEPRSANATGLPAPHTRSMTERPHPRAILDLIAESDLTFGQAALSNCKRSCEQRTRHRQVLLGRHCWHGDHYRWT
jgi:hypothetical protein